MDNGWVKIHRKLTEWEWFTDVNVAHLFLYCILSANHEDRKWRGIEIKRGTFITSLDGLADSTGLTVRQVRTALDKLCKTGEIEQKTTNKYRVITISKYEDYQLVEDAERQTNDKQATIKCQTNDKQTTTNKNIKKEKERKENIIGGDTCVCACVREEDVLVGIRDFYEQMGKVYVPNTTTMQDAKEICGHLRVAYGENATKEQWDGFLKTAWANCEDWQWIRDNFTLSTISRKFTEIINHKKNERSNNNRGASGLLIVHTPSNGSSTDF